MTTIRNLRDSGSNDPEPSDTQLDVAQSVRYPRQDWMSDLEWEEFQEWEQRVADLYEVELVDPS